MGHRSRRAANARLLANTPDRVVRRMRRSTLALLALAATTAGSAQLTIEEPRPDSLVTSVSTSVRGTVTGNADVALLVGEQLIPVESGGGAWSASNVPLPETLNELTVTAGALDDAVLVTKATSLPERPPQVVMLNWSLAATEEIKKIAVGTRQATLDADQKNAFAQAVKSKTELLIAKSFAPFAIEITTASTGAGAHVVNFLGMSNGSTYGETAVDCGNSNPAGTSNVWVGSLGASMVSSLSAWAPMKRGDKLAVRIDDVAYALAHTATHEIGHGLGLVVSSTPFICRWMNGCSGDHDSQHLRLVARAGGSLRQRALHHGSRRRHAKERADRRGQQTVARPETRAGHFQRVHGRLFVRHSSALRAAMNGLLRTVALVAVASSSAPIHAVDLMFGADALPELIDASDSVVEASRLELVRGDHDAVLVYRAVVEDTVAGIKSRPAIAC